MGKIREVLAHPTTKKVALMSLVSVFVPICFYGGKALRQLPLARRVARETHKPTLQVWREAMRTEFGKAG